MFKKKEISHIKFKNCENRSKQNCNLNNFFSGRTLVDLGNPVY